MICSSSHTRTSLKFGFRFNPFWISYQKLRYIFYMYIGFNPYTICFKLVSISCFCIHLSFGENDFSFQKFKFWKIQFLFKGQISISQKWFKLPVICVEFFNTYLLFKDLIRTYFCIYMSFGENSFSFQKSKFWKIRILCLSQISI